jgi:NAD(P)-dependent dehydrogenase (short-subunit alcohol dehydrogenase family)
MSKVALITGGGGGIGLAYAKALLNRGCWKVALLDISPGSAEARATELNSTFGAGLAIGFEIDVTNASAYRTTIDHVQGDFGPISLFINNAGVINCWFADIEKQVAVNLIACIRGTEMAIYDATEGLTKKASPQLDIVCTASSNGLIPADSDCAPVYCATKFGIVGFCRSLGCLAPRFNVRVNCICPVTVETSMTDPFFDSDGLTRRFLDSEGRGGVLPPEACAEVLLRIIDDPDPNFAGQVITAHPIGRSEGGVVVPVDPGGALAHLGTWRAADSEQVSSALDATLKSIAQKEMCAWSINNGD